MKKCLAIALLFSLHAAQAEEDKPDSFGVHHGYLFDVKEERNRRDVEMVMLQKPKDAGPALNDVIFNEKLSREFQQQYEYRFGQTLPEQVLNTPNRSDEYTYSTGATVTIKEHTKQQQNFGEYMARRLVEFHFDDWAKKDPDFKPVYAVKDRVSNVDVKMKGGYKLKWKYNFAGPNMDLRLENPYEVDAKIRFEMSGIVSAPQETILSLGYPITNRVRVTGLYKEYDGLYQLVLSRQMTKRLTCSLTGSSDRKPEGPTLQQDLVLVGLGWSE